jgi:tetratricopeptide (TPR) repeat protein
VTGQTPPTLQIMNLLPQADESRKKAEKWMVNTSSFFGLLGSSPNYLQAVEEYQKAGNLYRNAGKLEDAVDCFIKAAGCHKELNSMYLAAKSIETAAQISKGNPLKQSELYSDASKLYYFGNAPDRACEMLDKSAQALETVDVQKAILKYWESVGMYESEDRLSFSIDSIKRFMVFCIKSNQCEEAIKVSLRIQQIYEKLQNRDMYYRQVLSSIVLCLSLGQSERAQDVYRQSCTSLSMESSPEADLCLSFLNADTEEGLKVAVEHPTIRYLDVEIVRLTKTLKPAANVYKSLQDEIEQEGYL